MCFVEQKTFSVILRIFLTNAPPLWLPLYFGIQKCWRLQFLLKIVEEYGQNVYTYLKGIIMCFVEQKHFLWYYVFSSQMRHLCGSLCILVYKKCWRWQFLLKIVVEYGYNLYTDLKVIIMCFVKRKQFLWYYVFSWQMRHLCGCLCIFVYKNADVDNFYSKSLRSMAKMFMQI